jgi:hypothetical protein
MLKQPAMSDMERAYEKRYSREQGTGGGNPILTTIF